jgi:hypothetical protein
LARVLFANANSITQHRFTFTFPYGVSNRPFGDISISTQRLQTDWRKPSFLLLARRGWISQSFSFLPPKKGFRFFFLPSLFCLELNYPSQNVTKQMPQMKILMKIS